MKGMMNRRFQNSFITFTMFTFTHTVNILVPYFFMNDFMKNKV